MNIKTICLRALACVGTIILFPFFIIVGLLSLLNFSDEFIDFTPALSWYLDLWSFAFTGNKNFFSDDWIDLDLSK